jgi:dienelactone hydrolase
VPDPDITEAERREMQPVRRLWELYAPGKAPHAFRAKTAEEAAQWRVKTRRALDEALGFQDWPVVDPEPRTIESVDRGDYVREKVLLRTTPWTVMPVYILLPKALERPVATVIAFHGHGYGVKDIVGLWEDGSERNAPDGYHRDFAVALARRGFAVAAPEIACFGERQNDYTYLGEIMSASAPTSCHHTAALAIHLGGSVLGLRVFEAKRLVDYLATWGETDPSRLGAMGISGGGMLTFFSTCLDERIRACVVSGYFSTFRESILGVDHCTCNYVPGLGRFGEMHDLAGLVAPRAMLVEAGSRDPLFPIAAVERGVARAREVYAVSGADGALQTDLFEGRHQISGAKAYDFLAEALG